jgi:hypothetical protein
LQRWKERRGEDDEEDGCNKGEGGKGPTRTGQDNRYKGIDKVVGV